MKINYRKLGQTGFDVSTIGFGTWQLGGGRWKSDTKAKNISLLRKANDLGINIFDVSVVYGQYQDKNGYTQSRSQELLGEAFKDRRNKVFFCLKLGQFDEYAHRNNYEPERIVEQFKQSLRRLQTNYADITLIHAPSLQAVRDGRAISVLQTLRALGLTKAIGYSFENEPGHVEEAIKQEIDVIMLQYNLIDTECGSVIKKAEDHGIGILVGGPFKRGYLTGKFKTIENLPLEDNYWEWNINYNLGKVNKILNQVKLFLQKFSSPKKLREIALQYILMESGACSAIVGHRFITEVEENINSVSDIKVNKKKLKWKNK